MEQLFAFVVPDMDSCPFLLARKMNLQSTLYNIKFIVNSVCGCFTCSFVSFFVVTGMKMIRHLSFVCARIKIFRYVGFIFPHIISIWLCLWAPICNASLAVCCMPSCMSNFLSFVLLSVVSCVTLIMLSNSISVIPDNDGLWPSITMNIHSSLCLILNEHLLSSSMFG